MVCFQTKNPNLGKFWKALQWKMLVYVMDIWSILRSLGIFYGHLVYLVVIWYIFPFWYFVPRKIWHPCSRHSDKRMSYNYNASAVVGWSVFQSRKNIFSSKRTWLLAALYIFTAQAL
jgi:hypothetical protein